MQQPADAILAPAGEASTAQGSTLRWVFRRGIELIRCELALAPDHWAYELRTEPAPRGVASASEFFEDVWSAFNRQATIERMLLDAGWTLEQFETRSPARV